MENYEKVKASVARRVEWAQGLKAYPCSRCGDQLEAESMHWHHRDPSTKEFSIGQGAFRQSRKKLLAEIEKCDLLCEPCHIKEHHGVRIHGTRAMYKGGGCRCDLCRKAESDYRKRMVAQMGVEPIYLGL